MLMRRVLLVSVDSRSNNELGEFLRSAGFDLTAAAGPQHALDLLHGSLFDTIVLAAARSQHDGHEVCRTLRTRGIEEPIVILGCCGGTLCEVKAFEAGASDFIGPPVRPVALAARLRSHVDRHEFRSEAGLRIGRWVFSPRYKRLAEAAGARRIRLTDAEIALVRCLYWAQDRCATKESLLVDALGYSPAASTHTVETHVYRLRRKVERDARRPEFLVTVPHGYQLAADPVGRRSPMESAGNSG